MGQNYKAEMWLIMIKERSLFIYCPHLIFAEQMLFFFSFSSIYMEMRFHAEDVLRLIKNLIGRFDGGGRRMKYLGRFLFVSQP